MRTRVGCGASCRGIGACSRAPLDGANRCWLVPLPGSSHLFYHGDWSAVLETMLGFLGEQADNGPRLTDRELEVAALIAEGLTNHSIARRLSIAPRTAEAHVENIRRKLDVRSRAQIAAWVTEHRLGRGAPR